MLYLLPLTLLITANKCNNEDAGQYFNRPEFTECFTLGKPGYRTCAGRVEQIPASVSMPETQEQYEKLKEYYMQREQSDFECKKYKRCADDLKDFDAQNR